VPQLGAEKANWANRTRPGVSWEREPGRGMGIATHFCHLGYLPKWRM
jgi:hypothetical protein